VIWVAGLASSLLGPDALFGKLLQRLAFHFASNTVLA
jgi:hypothetical protein